MKKPSAIRNVVLISLDDMVAFWKYKSVFREALQTPNLDRICAQSTAFHSAYCQAPVCSPSRASFMSAKSPHQTGVLSSDKYYFERLPVENLWPHTLKQNGFYCSSGGKIAQSYLPLRKDLHRQLYSDHRKRFSLGRRPRKYANGVVSDDIERVTLGGFRGGIATVNEADDHTHYDHQVAESAQQFFETYDGDQPFYREVGMCAAHGPWKTPLRFKEMYNERNFHKPRAWLDGFDENAFIDEESPANIDNRQVREWKKSVRNYFSAVTHFDSHLGRIWDSLKASSHAENTLVVILSDHGLHLGERNRFRKHTLWEQVANVPLIIHDPTRPVAQVVTDPVGLIDVGPTIMDFMGQPAIADTPGQSLRSQMDWQSEPDRAIPTFLDGNAAIRKGRYRFIRYGDGSTQLFDLAHDWWQTRDLGKDHPDYAEMQSAHAACCASFGMTF